MGGEQWLLRTVRTFHADRHREASNLFVKDKFADNEMLKVYYRRYQGVPLCRRAVLDDAEGKVLHDRW